MRHALQETDGVIELSSDDEGFAVIYDGDKVTPEELLRAAKSTGYETTLRPKK